MLPIYSGYILERFGVQSIKDWVVEQQPNGDVRIRSSEGMEISVDPSYYTFAYDLREFQSAVDFKHPRVVALNMFGFEHGFFAYRTCSYHMVALCLPLMSNDMSAIVFGFMP